MSSVITTLAMDEQLAAELWAMKAEDPRVRDGLARDGSLFDGYHPRMKELHRRNAERGELVVGEVEVCGTNQALQVRKHFAAIRRSLC